MQFCCIMGIQCMNITEQNQTYIVCQKKLLWSGKFGYFFKSYFPPQHIKINSSSKSSSYTSCNQAFCLVTNLNVICRTWNSDKSYVHRKCWSYGIIVVISAGMSASSPLNNMPYFAVTPGFVFFYTVVDVNEPH